MTTPSTPQPGRPEAHYHCRFCNTPMELVMAELGSSPLANSYLSPEQLEKAESFYPLCVYVCRECWLAQLPAVESPEAIFGDYAYFSSYSDSWLAHARSYVESAAKRFGLGPNSLVVEVASNDGYLLQYFHERGVPVLGIEPAGNVAAAAVEKGIPTRSEFFGEALGKALAAEGKRADLMVSNNVLAHVPDLNDFVAGFRRLLAPEGVWTIEVPHLLRLLDEVQFDTIYHEHFSYFSLAAAQRVLAYHGLVVFDVEELSTHGGSLRIFVRHKENEAHPAKDRVAELLQREAAAGLETDQPYESFDARIQKLKRGLLSFLIEAKEKGQQVVGYGAPAKGNTLLNYCGIRTDLLDYTVDRSPHKQGHYLPGTRIPIHAPERILEDRPDYVLILPWNLEKEIRSQMKEVATWGGRFLIAVPEVRVFEN